MCDVQMQVSEGREGSSVFERITAREVLAAAAAMVESLVLHTNSQPKGMAITWFDPAEGTNTWAIRTRSGRAGLLELRADRVQPDHIRFRYKLVSANTTPTAGGGPGAPATAAGLAAESELAPNLEERTVGVNQDLPRG